MFKRRTKEGTTREGGEMSEETNWGMVIILAIIFIGIFVCAILGK